MSAFLDALAAASPAPAAGSAAALVLAQAAALCAKSARLSSRHLGEEQAGELIGVAERVRTAATELIDADAAAYQDVIAAARAARAAFGARAARETGSEVGDAADVDRANETITPAPTGRGPEDGAQASAAANNATTENAPTASAQPGNPQVDNAGPDNGQARSEAAADVVRAMSRAADVPCAIIALAAEIAGPAAVLAASGNPNLRGDAQSAALLAQGAASSAARLVAINLADAPRDPRIARAARLLTRIDVLTTEMASPD